MSVKPTSFDEYVIASVLANNQFGVTEVNNLESLKSVFFVREEYPIVEEFIEAGDVEAIKAFPEAQPRAGEYLDVMLFTDQRQKKYFVTVYDSNALEQDPQVIKIYQLQ